MRRPTQDARTRPAINTLERLHAEPARQRLKEVSLL
jgi:hypothetical protein